MLPTRSPFISARPRAGARASPAKITRRRMSYQSSSLPSALPRRDLSFLPKIVARPSRAPRRQRKLHCARPPCLRHPYTCERSSAQPFSRGMHIRRGQSAMEMARGFSRTLRGRTSGSLISRGSLACVLYTCAPFGGGGERGCVPCERLLFD